MITILWQQLIDKNLMKRFLYEAEHFKKSRQSPRGVCQNPLKYLGGHPA